MVAALVALHVTWAPAECGKRPMDEVSDPQVTKKGSAASVRLDNSEFSNTKLGRALAADAAKQPAQLAESVGKAQQKKIQHDSLVTRVDKIKELVVTALVEQDVVALQRQMVSLSKLPMTKEVLLQTGAGLLLTDDAIWHGCDSSSLAVRKGVEVRWRALAAQEVDPQLAPSLTVTSSKRNWLVGMDGQKYLNRLSRFAALFSQVGSSSHHPLLPGGDEERALVHRKMAQRMLAIGIHEPQQLIGLEIKDFEQMKLPQLQFWLLKSVLSKLNDLSDESKSTIIGHNPMRPVTVASAMLLGEQLTDASLESLVKDIGFKNSKILQKRA